MFSKKMLLEFKHIPFQAFFMHDERTDSIYTTYHYELKIRKVSWFGLVDKIITEKAKWNASDRNVIEKKLTEIVGQWV